MHRRRFDARPMGTISMSVQEYLSTSPPQDALRWMGMRRALIVIALAAVVAIAGVAAYVYLYEGSLDVAVQDDSGAWADVWVTFTQVWVHEAGKSEDVGWHNLTVAQASIDLASLVDVSEVLASARVGPGKYTEIRLVVIAATGRMLDGTNVVFSVPSGDVKAVTPFEIRSGAATRLTVDVHLVRDLQLQPNSLLLPGFVDVVDDKLIVGGVLLQEEPSDSVVPDDEAVRQSREGLRIVVENVRHALGRSVS